VDGVWVEWASWYSGDCVRAPDRHGGEVEQAEVLRRVAVGFRRVIIDWPEGDRWAEARVAHGTAVGFGGGLLDLERALRGRSVLVSAADAAGPEAAWVRFYMTPDTGLLELGYQPPSAVAEGRALAAKLAGLLGYEFVPWEADEHAEPGAAADGGA
jgi:hypothetical protein